MRLGTLLGDGPLGVAEQLGDDVGVLLASRLGNPFERVLASDAALERSSREERGRWSLGEEVELGGRATPTRLGTPTGAG